MCKFNKCQGPHACFLKNISPCPSALGAEGAAVAADIERVTSRPRSRGFIRQDELLEALGVADAGQPMTANVQAAPSKPASVAEFLSARGASYG